MVYVTLQPGVVQNLRIAQDALTLLGFSHLSLPNAGISAAMLLLDNVF